MTEVSELLVSVKLVCCGRLRLSEANGGPSGQSLATIPTFAPGGICTFASAFRLPSPLYYTFLLLIYLDDHGDLEYIEILNALSNISQIIVTI